MGLKKVAHFVVILLFGFFITGNMTKGNQFRGQILCDLGYASRKVDQLVA